MTTSIPAPASLAAEGEKVVLGVRPESLKIVDESQTGALVGKVIFTEVTGADTIINLGGAGHRCSIVVHDRRYLKTGEKIHLMPDSGTQHYFEASGRGLRFSDGTEAASV